MIAVIGLIIGIVLGVLLDPTVSPSLPAWTRFSARGAHGWRGASQTACS